MTDRFPEILRYHPAYLSGRFGRPESEFAKPESLARKPEVGDRLSFIGGVATLIGLLVLAVVLGA